VVKGPGGVNNDTVQSRISGNTGKEEDQGETEGKKEVKRSMHWHKLREKVKEHESAEGGKNERHKMRKRQKPVKNPLRKIQRA